MEGTRNVWFFILCFPAVATLGGPSRSSSKPRFVTANHRGEVTLLCGFNGTKIEEEFQVVLYKGVLNKTSVVCFAIFSNWTIQPSKAKDLSRCEFRCGQSNVSITIRDLNVTDTDRYICNILKIYPPPYQQISGQWTIINVNQVASCPPEVETGHCLPLTAIFTILAALLLLYSVSVTVVYCRHKMKIDEIYINVRT
ncbi:T-cell-specific surface glycoprotein CD28-like [Rhinoraja longicauda]